MIKSPLRYPGGKSRAVKFLYNFIPDFTEFREPLFGGGSLSFFLIQKSQSKFFKASEINFDLYCFWSELKTNNTKMIREIFNVYENCKEGRSLYKTILGRRNSNLNNFQRAVDFFILNRITFSGVVDSGGYSEQAFHKRFTKSSIERLLTASHVIQNIDFYHSDYSHLLENCHENTFIFLDPPYYSATKSKLYGKNGDLHLNFDHELLKKHLSSCKCKWLITYDNSGFINDLYKDYYTYEWLLQYGMNNYKKDNSAKGKELLIANYDLKETEKINMQKQHELFTESV